MASIETRVNAKGVKTWRVVWREDKGGRGAKKDYETCDKLGDAKAFKILVEAAGERRPEGYPRGCRGVKPAPAEPEPVESGRTFKDVTGEYLATRVDTEPRTVAEYRRDLNTHVYPAVVRTVSRSWTRTVVAVAEGWSWLPSLTSGV